MNVIAAVFYYFDAGRIIVYFFLNICGTGLFVDSIFLYKMLNIFFSLSDFIDFGFFLLLIFI